MVGILVHGDNHFIVRGALPDRNVALALVRHWSFIRIGATTPPPLDGWHIVSREVRENLDWAVVVPGDGEMSPAIITLLEELLARGITCMTFDWDLTQPQLEGRYPGLNRPWMASWQQ